MGCVCGRGVDDGQIPSRLGTYDFGADPAGKGGPLADWYEAPLVHINKRSPAAPGYDVAQPAPRLRPTEPIGPGYAYTPHPPATALARWHTDLDEGEQEGPFGGAACPVTAPQRNYGYANIYSRQVEPLEGPRYSYAAMDTELILEEAQARAQEVFLR